jgi:hypothetical protein
MTNRDTFKQAVCPAPNESSEQRLREVGTRNSFHRRGLMPTNFGETVSQRQPQQPRFTARAGFPRFLSFVLDLTTAKMIIPQLTTGSFCCFGLKTRVSDQLVGPIHFGSGIYALTEPPFYVDEWWREQLGKIKSGEILRCRLFLLAQTEDPALEVPDLSSRWWVDVEYRSCG